MDLIVDHLVKNRKSPQKNIDYFNNCPELQFSEIKI
ncbi:MAG: hypothetical protein ACI9N9_002708 [Enterobacterales bacterium]|jgi:hypothetical protein